MSKSSEENNHEPEVLPEGNLAIPTPRLVERSLMPQAEARFRQWAIQNGVTVKCVHIHHLPEFDTVFAIFETPKDS